MRTKMNKCVDTEIRHTARARWAIAATLGAMIAVGGGTPAASSADRVAIGRDSDSYQVKRIADGETTKTDLVEWFGLPAAVTTQDGKQIDWSWHYVRGDGYAKQLLVAFQPPDYNVVGRYRFEEGKTSRPDGAARKGDKP